MIELDVENFEEKIQDKKYFLDFHGQWCGPCKVLAPILEQVEKETGVPVYKVDVDSLPDAAVRYGIRSVPTVILMKDGKQVSSLTGSMPKTKYLELVNSGD